MSRAPKHCGIDGCRTLVPGGTRCELHKHRFVNGGQSRTSDPRHRAWRREVLRNAKGACQIQRPGCTHRATEADHIVEVADGGDKLDPANGRGACRNCRWLEDEADTPTRPGMEDNPLPLGV